MQETPPARPYVSVFLVIEKDGKILMQRRFNTGHEDGNYGLVSGHVDVGERVDIALAREAKEESNLDIDPTTLKVALVLHNLGYAKKSGREYFNIFLVTDTWSGEPEIMEPDCSDDLSWFPKDELPENTIGYVRFALEEIEKGHFYSTFV